MYRVVVMPYNGDVFEETFYTKDDAIEYIKDEWDGEQVKGRSWICDRADLLIEKI